MYSPPFGPVKQTLEPDAPAFPSRHAHGEVLQGPRVSLLPPSAAFHELVQECFVVFRGRGVSLSADDVELLDTWARRDVPFEIVARGIRRTAEARLVERGADATALHSLATCRRAVEREIAKYLRATAGRGADTGTGTDTSAPTEAPAGGDPTAGAEASASHPPAPRDAQAWYVTRHQKLLRTLRQALREHPHLAARAAPWLDRLATPSAPDDAARQESLVLALLCRAIEPGARRALLREAQSLVQKAALMTARARLESLRFHREVLVRRALALPSFW